MKLAKLGENLLFVVIFCVLLGCTTTVIDYIQAHRAPQAILKTLRVLQDKPVEHGSAAPQALFHGKQIKKTLLGLIDKSEPHDKILIATFIMTDSDIAQALKAKHHQGVAITIVADSGHAQKDHSKLVELIKAGICVYLHNPTSPDIMHNKFLIFEFQDGQHVVVTGSYNLTNSAAQKNAENVVLIVHPETINEYKNHFLTLQKNSIPAQKSTPKKLATTP